jgi:iron complex outermembrane receptor protein
VDAIGATRQLFFYAPNLYTAVCSSNNAIPAPNLNSCVLPATTSSQTSKKPTWLIDLDYKPTADTLLYAKYSRGYRQGNINASNTLPQEWGPEKVDTYEVGAKASFRGALSGYVDIAGFYNDFSNQQLAAQLYPSPGSTASPAQAIVNAGKSRIEGVEVDSQFNYSIFGLAAGYSYLNTKLKSFAAVNFPGYLPAIPSTDVGGPLPYTPEHKLLLTPSIRLPIDNSLGRVSVSGTYVYTSSQVMAAASQSPVTRIAGFSIVNLNLGWESIAGLPVDVSAFVTNLTNKKYYTYTSGSFVQLGYDYNGLGQPRMFGMRLRVRFGD